MGDPVGLHGNYQRQERQHISGLRIAGAFLRNFQEIRPGVGTENSQLVSKRRIKHSIGPGLVGEDILIFAAAHARPAEDV